MQGMQVLSLVGELRSQIHTVGPLSQCATAREAVCCSEHLAQSDKTKLANKNT